MCTTIENALYEINSTSSTKEKEELITYYADNPIFQEVLHAAYDTSMIYGVKKIAEVPTTNTPKYIHLQEAWGPIVAPLLQALAQKKLTGNKALLAITEVLQQVDATTQIVIRNILQKDLRCGINSGIINKAIPNLLGNYKVQLASPYDPNKAYDAAMQTMYISPKMDGLRFRYEYDANTQTGVMYTRQGQVIAGFLEHEAEMQDYCQNYNLAILDGELYHPDVKFQELQSIIMSRVDLTKEQIQKKALVRANIFLVIPAAVEYTKTTLEFVTPSWGDIKRTVMCLNSSMIFMEDLAEFIWESLCTDPYPEQVEYDDKIDPRNIPQFTPGATTPIYNYLTPVPYVKWPVTAASMQFAAKRFMELGFEGVMARDNYEVHNESRSNKLLKYKTFKEVELNIIAMEEGEGKYQGMLGNFICEGALPDGTKIRTKAGSGLSDEDRITYWKDRHTCVRATIEIKYQGVTDKPKHGVYSLRFPTILKVKYIK